MRQERCRVLSIMRAAALATRSQGLSLLGRHQGGTFQRYDEAACWFERALGQNRAAVWINHALPERKHLQDFREFLHHRGQFGGPLCF